MTNILDKATDIIDFIVKGIGEVFNFILELPSFIKSLIEIIPSPFKEVMLGFIGLIICYFIAKAVLSLVN